MRVLLLLAACASGPADTGEPVEIEPGAPGAPRQVSLLPAEPNTLDDLVLVIGQSAVDPDGDLVGYRMRWTADGQPAADLDDERRVPAAVTVRDQVWEVAVHAYDAGGREGPAVTAAVTIANLPPGDPVVTITPAEPIPGEDDLHCAAEATDRDTDPVQITTWWEQEGLPYEGDVVAAADLDFDQVWVCSAQASDGTASSGVATASVRTSTSARVPDFSLVDVNATSPSYDQQVSPRDYLEQVSGWYFVHST